MKFLSIFIALFAISCGNEQKQVPDQKTPEHKTPEQVQSNSPKDSQQVSDSELALLETAYKNNKATFEKNPEDMKSKNDYINATFAVGMGRMYSVSLPPREKYTTALSAFREVLKISPAHKEAKENVDMIAGIYKQMGRPVPGGN